MPIRMLVPALLVSALAGCKAAPAKPAGFVIESRMTKADDLPFHSAWRNPEADFARYDRVHVAPVDTSYLLEMDWWKQGEAGSVNDFEADVKKIAEEFRETLRAMYEKPPDDVENRFTVSDVANGRRTLVLEVAVVEIVPSKVTLEALSWAMPFGTGILLTPLNTSTAAMEGRFRDAATGDVVLSFADREGEKARPVDLAGFTWFTHARGIMKDWAKQLVQVTNQKPGEAVGDTKTYTLKPW